MALRDLPPWRRPHTLGLASTGSDGYTRQILSAYEQQAAIGVRGAAIGALARIMHQGPDPGRDTRASVW